MLTIIAVASGGAIGAILRFLVNGLANRYFVNTFPFGTLAVNLAGSLLIGMFFAYFHLSSTISPWLKTFLVTGILGAFTTYSTFAIESFFLLEAGEYFRAFLNIVFNLFGTIVLAGVGYLLILKFGN